MQQTLWREEESTLSPSNNRSTSICYFLNGDSKINSEGVKRKWDSEILTIPSHSLDTLISLPPSSLLPYRMFAWRKNETGKTEEKQWLMKRTREKRQFLWMVPLAARCFQGSRPQYSNISNCLQKFLRRVIDCTKHHPW